MRRRPPLEVGAKYNDWTVVEQVSLSRVICKCKCGNKREISISHMIGSKSKRCRSCGNDLPSYKWRPLQFSNGSEQYLEKLKTAVTDAIIRCTNKNNKNYHNYGGRGIKIHQLWLDDPRLFIEYLMTLEGWDLPKLFMDRINNDGNYEPGNLRFVTIQESNNNQRHPGPPTILTKEQILEAKQLRKERPKLWTYARLGDRYNVSSGTVFNALTGKTYKKDKV